MPPRNMLLSYRYVIEIRICYLDNNRPGSEGRFSVAFECAIVVQQFGVHPFPSQCKNIPMRTSSWGIRLHWLENGLLADTNCTLKTNCTMGWINYEPKILIVDRAQKTHNWFCEKREYTMSHGPWLGSTFSPVDRLVIELEINPWPKSF